MDMGLTIDAQNLVIDGSLRAANDAFRTDKPL